MTTPKDFLKNRLKAIFETVKSINIKYQYYAEHDTHLVEVTPIDEFDGNSEYVDLERDLLFEFNEMYFPSTLIFTTEGSLNRVEVPAFSFERKPELTFNISDIEMKNYISDIIASRVEVDNNYALAA